MERIEFDAGHIGLYRLTNASLHQFCIGIVIKAGSMYETREENGYAHLYEHMVFRNLKKHFGDGFYTLLARHGVEVDATTYTHCILFQISGIKEGFSFACEILSQMFGDLTVTAQEFHTEKCRVKAEIGEKEERTTLAYRCKQAIWEGTSLCRTVHGYCRNIDRASILSLNRYKNGILSEGNVFAVLTGNADEKDAELLRDALARIPLSDGEIKTNDAPVPAGFGRRPRMIHTHNAYYTNVFLSFDNADALPDKYKADLMSYVLFYGYDSMVSQALSENNPLIYSYDSWNVRYSNIGIFTLEYEVGSKNLEASLTLLAECFRAIREGRFDFETNLQKALTDYTFSFDNAFSKCTDIALNLVLFRGDHEALNREPEKLKSVTKEDIMRLAEKTFVKERMALGVQGNKRALDRNTERFLQCFDEM